MSISAIGSSTSIASVQTTAKSDEPIKVHHHRSGGASSALGGLSSAISASSSSSSVNASGQSVGNIINVTA
ncbi:hypothetical protein GW590_02705 [Rahnella sp. SAP-1]|uniref:Uncharacterized protein n=1 Tax=Rouxiella aceris TaxID=2703884 RepID=A0A848MC14_9GAMM|nr:hypothetical protein [Rouxiella aceris]NMP25788.1 hypothetical protein [Rouxiella aceris]